ncbi:MAG: protease inhibitor I42 family protein [Mycobacterium leprae]
MTEVQLSMGQSYALRLRGMAGAGYTWEYAVTGDAAAIDILWTRLEPQPATAPGGPRLTGGSHDLQVVIVAVGQGNVQVRFSLRRPWETDRPALEQQELDLTID